MLRKFIAALLLIVFGFFASSVFAQDVDLDDYIPFSNPGCPIPPGEQPTEDYEGDMSSICGRVFRATSDLIPMGETGEEEWDETSVGVGGVTVAIYEAIPGTQTGKVVGIEGAGLGDEEKAEAAAAAEAAGEPVEEEEEGVVIGHLFAYTTTTLVDPDGREGGFFYLNARKSGSRGSRLYLVVFCNESFDTFLLSSKEHITNMLFPVECPYENEAVEPPIELDLTQDNDELQCDNFPLRSVSVGNETQNAATIKFDVEELNFDNRYRGGLFKQIQKIPFVGPIITKFGAFKGGERWEDCIINLDTGYGRETEELCASYFSDIEVKLSAEDDAATNTFRHIPWSLEGYPAYRPMDIRGGLIDYYNNHVSQVGGLLHSAVGSVPHTDKEDEFVPLRYAKKEETLPLPDCQMFLCCNETISSPECEMYNYQKCGGYAILMSDPTIWEDLYGETPPYTPVCTYEGIPILLSQIQPTWEPSCDGYTLCREYFRPEITLIDGSGRVPQETEASEDSREGESNRVEEFNIEEEHTEAEYPGTLQEGNNPIIPAPVETIGKVSPRKTTRVFTTDIAGEEDDLLYAVFNDPTFEEDMVAATATGGTSTVEDVELPPATNIGYIGRPYNLCSLSFITGENPVILTVKQEQDDKTVFDMEFDPFEETEHRDDRKAATSYYITEHGVRREECLSGDEEDITLGQVLNALGQIATDPTAWNRCYEDSNLLIGRYLDALHTTCVEDTDGGAEIDLSCAFGEEGWHILDEGVFGTGFSGFFGSRSDEFGEPEVVEVFEKFKLSQQIFDSKFPIPGPSYVPSEWALDDKCYEWKSLKDRSPGSQKFCDTWPDDSDACGAAQLVLSKEGPNPQWVGAKDALRDHPGTSRTCRVDVCEVASVSCLCRNGVVDTNLCTTVSVPTPCTSSDERKACACARKEKPPSPPEGTVCTGPVWTGIGTGCTMSVADEYTCGGDILEDEGNPTRIRPKSDYSETDFGLWDRELITAAAWSPPEEPLLNYPAYALVDLGATANPDETVEHVTHDNKDYRAPGGYSYTGMLTPAAPPMYYESYPEYEDITYGCTDPNGVIDANDDEWQCPVPGTEVAGDEDDIGGPGTRGIGGTGGEDPIDVPPPVVGPPEDCVRCCDPNSAPTCPTADIPECTGDPSECPTTQSLGCFEFMEAHLWPSQAHYNRAWDAAQYLMNNEGCYVDKLCAHVGTINVVWDDTVICGLASGNTIKFGNAEYVNSSGDLVTGCYSYTSGNQSDFDNLFAHESGHLFQSAEGGIYDNCVDAANNAPPSGEGYMQTYPVTGIDGNHCGEHPNPDNKHAEDFAETIANVIYARCDYSRSNYPLHAACSDDIFCR
ncbi:hypothetical protein ACFL13_02770 [Patescibacteria group bacterium]